MHRSIGIGSCANNIVFADGYPRGLTIFQVGVTLYNISPADERQLDMLHNDDVVRQRWERANAAVDTLNTRYPAQSSIWATGSLRPVASRRQDQLHTHSFGGGLLAMGWKQKSKVSDLVDNQKLKVMCRRCGHVHCLNKAIVCVLAEREFLYIDALERETRCRARGCRGAVRLSMVRLDEMSGFVGGLA